MPTSLTTTAVADQYNFDGVPFPLVVTPPQTTDLAAACDWVRLNLSEINLSLAASGTILFRGFPIDSAESFDTFSAAFNYPSFTYRESLSNAVRINFTERVFTANEAPKDVEIYLHHEMAQTPISPDKLFFFCKSAASEGGASPLCRSDQLLKALRLQAPTLADEFAAKGLKYTTYMPATNDPNSGQGRSWMNTLNVDSVAAAETKLQHLGYTWEWQGDGSLKAVTPVLPAIKKLANGTEVFYNQLIAAYLGWKGVRENPARAITYGDGSHIQISTLELLVKLSQDFTYDVPWQDGDVALIDNNLTMHGRRPFTGNRPRQVLVALTAAVS